MEGSSDVSSSLRSLLRRQEELAEECPEVTERRGERLSEEDPGHPPGLANFGQSYQVTLALFLPTTSLLCISSYWIFHAFIILLWTFYLQFDSQEQLSSQHSCEEEGKEGAGTQEDSQV